MDYTEPQFHPQLKQLAVQIDSMDYFQILNLPQTASLSDVKKTYFAQSRALHPDRFYHLDDVELKNAIHKIYKRITEAYVILKDSEKRAKYTANIAGENRLASLRFNEQAEEAVKKDREEAREICKTPKGRKIFRQVEADLRAEKWDAAFRNLQTIALFEPGNTEVAQLKAEIDKKRKA